MRQTLIWTITVLSLGLVAWPERPMQFVPEVKASIR